MSNILCMSVFDNGQQMQSLAEAFRKYTDHDCVHVNLVQSYLDYDADVKLPELTDPKRVMELSDSISECDFFIFSEVMPSYAKDVLDELHIFNKIHPSNTIIRTAGTFSRSRSDEYRTMWLDDGWMFAGPLSDWSISGSIGRVAPVNYICPVHKIPQRTIPDDDTTRICFAPTKKAKGIDEFKAVLRRIENEYDDVIGVPIIGKTWNESVRIKAMCDITFDQFMIPTYANSSIESMYLHHAVVSDISPWCRVVHPDLPVISAHNEEGLYRVLVDLIENKELDWIGKEGHEYVLNYHHPSVVVEQWSHLIDHVKQN